ncbi:AMP-dependent synthetase [Bacillaceae bacterium SAS-127]|nr:AMP-dependent synthetase [Bacillaceae bacterium SAS-127]
MDSISVVNRVALGDIIRRSANRFPEKLALIEGEKQLTYRELDEETNRFANYLLESGLQKGETVATICGNSWQFIVAIFGIQKAGLIWVPINPGISTDEKLYILTEVKAKLLIGDEEFLKAKGAFQTICSDILIIGDSIKGPEYFEYSLRLGDKIEPDVNIQDRDIAQIMFTSGTTGRPKGVKISHLAVYIASLGNIIEMDVKRNDVGTAMMPIFHCAQHTLVTSFLHLGASVVVLRSFEPNVLLKTIKKEKITWMFALPMMYRLLLAHPSREKSDTESLRFCIYAMTPMDETTLRKAMKEFDAEFALATGQTEMYPLTVMFKPEDQLRKKGSYWGTSSIINDTAIMNENGELLSTGEIGEIVHRGPNVMSGYLNNPEETEKTRHHYWHQTGDLGYFDEDGLLVFVDRKKDIIKTGGENVASILVEQTLLDCEKVANAVVVGLPHERWGEAITAFIVLKSGEQMSKEEIISHCKERLGAFQTPKEIVFVDQLPTTTTGKILKHVLREKHEKLYVK